MMIVYDEVGNMPPKKTLLKFHKILLKLVKKGKGTMITFSSKAGKNLIYFYLKEKKK